MGLDVGLVRYEKDIADARQREQQYQECCSKIWKASGKKFEELTKEEKDALDKRCEDVANQLGLNEGGEEDKEWVEIPSSKYPDHYFKIGYFRSSYNEGGINRVMENAIGMTLYDIFPEAGDEYIVEKIDWTGAKKRTRKALAMMKNFVAQNGDFRVSNDSFNPLLGDPKNYAPSSNAEALKVFLNEKKQHDENQRKRIEELKKQGKDPAKERLAGIGEWYSNKSGRFFLGKERLQVAGVILGIQPNYLTQLIGKTARGKLKIGGGDAIPAVYLIYEDKGFYDWYIKALEIVEETIDYVLTSGEPEKYALSWSG